MKRRSPCSPQSYVLLLTFACCLFVDSTGQIYNSLCCVHVWFMVCSKLLGIPTKTQPSACREEIWLKPRQLDPKSLVIQDINRESQSFLKPKYKPDNTFIYLKSALWYLMQQDSWATSLYSKEMSSQSHKAVQWSIFTTSHYRHTNTQQLLHKDTWD